MAINVRAFAQPPCYEIRKGKHVIIMDMLNWNGHPRFGSSVHEFTFDDQRTALDYMEKVTGHVVRVNN